MAKTIDTVTDKDTLGSTWIYLHHQRDPDLKVDISHWLLDSDER